MTPSQKLPKNVGDLGKLSVAKAFKKLPKVQKNRQIWSHCVVPLLLNWTERQPSTQVAIISVLKSVHKTSSNTADDGCSN